MAASVAFNSVGERREAGDPIVVRKRLPERSAAFGRRTIL
jgi:hypothetical protein